MTALTYAEFITVWTLAAIIIALGSVIYTELVF